MEYNNDLIENSICKSCENLISRLIVPVDYEEFGIDLSSLKEEIENEEGVPIEDEDIAIIHNTCIVLNMDIGHVVLECNKYKNSDVDTVFKLGPWKK